MSLVHDPAPTETAVLVPVPALEPVVATHRRRLDSSAAWGVPAHVTVLYPFVAPADLAGSVVADLARAVSSVPSFDCVFAAARWFGEEVVWLAPEPDAPFRRLTEAVCRAFPTHPPYGGVHADVVPHLTVGESPPGTPTELRAAARTVLASLPVAVRVDHVVLMAGTTAPDAWHPVAELPLGGT